MIMATAAIGSKGSITVLPAICSAKAKGDHKSISTSLGIVNLPNITMNTLKILGLVLLGGVVATIIALVLYIVLFRQTDEREIAELNERMAANILFQVHHSSS